MKVSMNLKAKKLSLVQLILNTDKPALLAKVEAVFKNEKGRDWWNEISENERKATDMLAANYSEFRGDLK